MTAASTPKHPIILITGATSGLGYGIALRLLQFLSLPPPPLCPSTPLLSTSEFPTPSGCTLIIAARNPHKAHKVRRKLLKDLGALEMAEEEGKPIGMRGLELVGGEARRERKKRVLEGMTRERGLEVEWNRNGNGNGNGANGSVKHVNEESNEKSPLLNLPNYHKPPPSSEPNPTSWKLSFLSNLRIEFVGCDLNSYDSVMNCVEEVKERYPYISHLFLNAGGGAFTGVDFLLVTRRILRNLVQAVTYPDFMLEQKGLKTSDGLGYTFQMNVFSHYLMAKHLLPMVHSAPYKEPRIIWTGSMDGLPAYFHPDDPQALTSLGAYQSAKYSVGLTAWKFNEYIKEVYPTTDSENSEHGKVTSLLCHPGIIAGNMFTDLIGYWLDLGMLLVFYLARWLGSQNHPVSPQLAAFAFLAVGFSSYSSLSSFPMDPPASPPRRFAARCTFFGRPYLGLDSVVLPDARGKWWDDKNAEIVWKECEKEERRLRGEKKEQEGKGE